MIKSLQVRESDKTMATYSSTWLQKRLATTQFRRGLIRTAEPTGCPKQLRAHKKRAKIHGLLSQ